MQFKDPAEEIKRLQRCINDLVALLALPAVWSGSHPSEAVQILLDALVRMLSLDLVYVRLKNRVGEAPIEALRMADSCKLTVQPEDLRELLANWIRGNGHTSLPPIRKFQHKDISISFVPLGLQGEIGMLVAGSERADFPMETDKLVLRIAANQASIGLQEARLLGEQKRIANELEQRVAERTAGFAAANEELKNEIADRKLKEEELRLKEQALREAHTHIAQSEERWRSVFENSAIGVALTDLSGRFIATNPVYQKMLGYTEEELQQIRFLDVTVEEDRDKNWVLVGELLAGKRQQFQIEKQYRRKDGSRVWVRNSVSVVPGTELIPRFLMALSEDITERKQAEEELRRSEAKIRRLVEANVVGIVRFSLEGAIIEANEAFLRMVHYSAEDLASGRLRWRDITPAEWCDRDEWAMAELKATGIFQPFEKEYFRKDGARVPVLLGGALFEGSGNEGVAFILDLSEQKRADEELRRSEVLLAESQRLSLTGSFSWRVATDEITWSEQLYRIYEFEIGVPVTLELVRSRVHPEDVSLIEKMKMVDEARGGGSDFEWQWRLLMPDRSIKYLHAVAHATRGEDGQLEYTAAVQDVTARRLSEEARDKARSELARVARVISLGTLAASIAHEVNQPLSGIVTNASTCLRMLSADPPNVDGARETARRTIRDGNRAAEVITRLRTLFTKKAPSPELMDLNEATGEVIALSLSELQRKQVTLRVELGDDLPPVSGDRVQLQQVILNLIRNASEAMSTVDDRPRELLIRTERDEGDCVRLSVKDTGVGLDPQAVDRLFEVFYTTKNDGMGIGLSVSRTIVENHRGRLWAAPNDGPGATFSFSIPCKPERSAGDVRMSVAA